MYASRKTDFLQAVTNHWRSAHPALLASQPSLEQQCRTITLTMLPTVTAKQAARLVLQLPALPPPAALAPTTPGSWTLSSRNTVARREREESPATSAATTPAHSRATTPAKSPFADLLDAQAAAFSAPEEDHELPTFSGPFQCSSCCYKISKSLVTSKVVLQHWTKIHGTPHHLEFVDQETNQKLRVGDFYSFVGKCRKCTYYTGQNRCEVDLKLAIKKHWEQKHKSAKVGQEETYYELVEHQDKEGSPPGSFQCKVDTCREQWEEEEGWQRRVLQHFHSSHDHLINELVVEEQQTGRKLRIQHMFSHVGQCNIADCLSINGVMGPEIVNTFAEHFTSQHPGREVDYSLLVEDHVPRFETSDQEEEEPVLSCGQCCVVVPTKEAVLDHWNQEHKVARSGSLLVRCEGKMRTAQEVWGEVGRCSRCSHLLAGPSLQEAAKKHYAKVHDRHLTILRAPDHFTWEVGGGKKEARSRSQEQAPISPVKSRSKSSRAVCEAADCKAVFVGSKEEVEQQEREHWEQEHGDMPSVESGGGCGYQCMAGAEDGEVGSGDLLLVTLVPQVVCSTVIPPGNNGNALRHWQYKHHSLPLR